VRVSVVEPCSCRGSLPVDGGIDCVPPRAPFQFHAGLRFAIPKAVFRGIVSAKGVGLRQLFRGALYV